MSAKIRNFSILALAGLLLASCAATSFPTFVKPGTTADRVSRDSAACDIEANRLFPAANFPVVFPYATVGYYPGAWGWGGGATITTTDVNANMRIQHRNQCMRVKGYTPYTFPICTTAQMNGQSFAPLTRSPTPSPNICAARLDGGGRALIDLTNPL